MSPLLIFDSGVSVCVSSCAGARCVGGAEQEGGMEGQYFIDILLCIKTSSPMSTFI